MSELNFSDLAEKSGQLVNRFQSTYQGFNINRSLKEIGEYSKQLNDTTSSKSSLYNDSYQKAVNRYHIEPKVIGESLSHITASSFVDVETIPTDVDQFLKGEFESMIMNTINDVQKKSIKEFNENYQRASISEWNKDKKSLEETLGQRFIKVHCQNDLLVSGNGSIAKRSMVGGSQLQLTNGGMNSSQLFMSSAGGFNNNMNNSMMSSQLMMSTSAARSANNIEDRTRLSNKMRSYAQVIFEYLAAKKQGEQYQLVENLAEAQLAEVTKYRQVIEDVWLLIQKLSAVTGAVNQEERTQSLIKKSIEFLQQQFVNSIKSKLPTISNISSPLEEIVSYVVSNVQKPPIDTPEDIYRNCSIWSIIYYALRSGYNEVVEQLLNHINPKYREIIKSSIIYRKEDKLCPKDVVNLLNKEYNMLRNESKDYFKIAVFNLLSSTDATNVHSNKILFPFIQDLLWWRLSFIKTQSYSLQTLQVAVNETIAQIQFDPYVLIQIHLLTCQFELGIAHFSLSNQEDALHYALALNVAGLIRKPRPEQTIIDSVDIYDPASKLLNLVTMIRQYIKSFSSETDNVEALHYYLLIEDENIQNFCISDLIVSSTSDTEFARYLMTIPEFIKKDQWSRIIQQTAITFEQKSNFQSAIAYWLLIEEYSRVLELYNSRMSSVVASNSNEKEQLYQFGMELFNDKQLEIKVSKSEKQAYLAFEQLLQLSQFFDLYNNQKYQDALELQDKLALLPKYERDIDTCVENYRFLSPHITRNFSSIIQATIDIIMKLYELVSIPSSSFIPPSTSQLYAGRQQTLNELQERSQALTLFAGKIDFPMSGNTLTKIMNFMIKTVK